MSKQNETTLIVTGGRVFTPYKKFEDGIVAIAGSKIAYVGDKKDFVVPPGVPIVDAQNGMICPGFIDLHVNGGGGKDITAGTEEAIYGIAKGHAVCGTTGLLVAVTGPSLEIAKKGLKSASTLSKKRTGGAKILGVHMEGPFVNPKRQGPIFKLFDNVTEPSIEVMKDLIDASNGGLKIINMSPEYDKSLEVIEYVISRGIRVSIGHTDASYEQAIAALQVGVSYASHIYNAMTGLNHREPGVVGALLTSSENVVIELVADGYHVHPAAIEILLSCKGIDNVVLASDATELVGTNLTSFTLPIGAGLRVEVRDGRTWGPDGQLIGSVLQMNHAVRNMHRWFGKVPLSQIIASATYVPATTIGVNDVTGSLEAGKAADIAVLDTNFELVATIVDGEIVSTGELITG